MFRSPRYPGDSVFHISSLPVRCAMTADAGVPLPTGGLGMFYWGSDNVPMCIGYNVRAVKGKNKNVCAQPIARTHLAGASALGALAMTPISQWNQRPKDSSRLVRMFSLSVALGLILYVLSDIYSVLWISIPRTTGDYVALNPQTRRELTEGVQEPRISAMTGMMTLTRWSGETRLLKASAATLSFVLRSGFSRVFTRSSRLFNALNHVSLLTHCRVSGWNLIEYCISTMIAACACSCPQRGGYSTASIQPVTPFVTRIRENEGRCSLFAMTTQL